MNTTCPSCHGSIEITAATDVIVCPTCGSSFRHDSGGTTTGWAPGKLEQIGKFALLEAVGRGAFGTVYKARDTELDRIVAVKVSRTSTAGGSNGDSQRFLREARSVAQLRHPSIVSIHEVGQHNGTPYLVQDFVHGITLADLLSGEHLEYNRSAELVTQIADALQYAHSQGVVHRDVKPSNVMIETSESSTNEPGRVSARSTSQQALGANATRLARLMDFGLAKRADGEETMTLEGQVLGTPAYMSPEQARGQGHEVDGRGDVYSLGVIFYQLLTGELPFKGNKQMLMHLVLNEEPKSPRKRNSQVPRDLETICLKAMAKEPGRRYQTAGEFAEDLRRYLRGEPILARRVGAIERTRKWIRRRPAIAALLAVAILALGAGGGVGAWFWKKDLDHRRQDEARLLAEEEAKQLKVGYFQSDSNSLRNPRRLLPRQ